MLQPAEQIEEEKEENGELKKEGRAVAATAATGSRFQQIRLISTLIFVEYAKEVASCCVAMDATLRST
jgi:hypothetical protein